MSQQILIVNDATERTTLVAKALRKNGYAVMTLQLKDNEALQASLRRLKPDCLVIGDEVVIELKAQNSFHMLKEMGIAC